MKDVKPIDLEKPNRLAVLFADAEQRGLVTQCQADKLAFFAAAERAKRVATRDTAGLFVQIVRSKFYAFVALEDEDRARRTLFQLLQERSATASV